MRNDQIGCMLRKEQLTNSVVLEIWSFDRVLLVLSKDVKNKNLSRF